MLASGSSGTAPALPRGALAPPAAAPPATTATTTTTKDRMMGDDTAAAVESRTAANATAIDRLARAAADPVSGVACRVMSDGHHDYPGCFTGQDLARWLQQKSGVLTQADILQAGQTLLDCHAFRSVFSAEQQEFAADHTVFQFAPELRTTDEPWESESPIFEDDEEERGAGTTNEHNQHQGPSDAEYIEVAGSDSAASINAEPADSSSAFDDVASSFHSLDPGPEASSKTANQATQLKHEQLHDSHNDDDDEEEDGANDEEEDDVYQLADDNGCHAAGTNSQQNNSPINHAQILRSSEEVDDSDDEDDEEDVDDDDVDDEEDDVLPDTALAAVAAAHMLGYHRYVPGTHRRSILRRSSAGDKRSPSPTGRLSFSRSSRLRWDLSRIRFHETYAAEEYERASWFDMDAAMDAWEDEEDDERLRQLQDRWAFMEQNHPPGYQCPERIVFNRETSKLAALTRQAQEHARKTRADVTERLLEYLNAADRLYNDLLCGKLTPAPPAQAPPNDIAAANSSTKPASPLAAATASQPAGSNSQTAAEDGEDNRGRRDRQHDWSAVQRAAAAAAAATSKSMAAKNNNPSQTPAGKTEGEQLTQQPDSNTTVALPTISLSPASDASPQPSSTSPAVAATDNNKSSRPSRSGRWRLTLPRFGSKNEDDDEETNGKRSPLLSRKKRGSKSPKSKASRDSEDESVGSSLSPPPPSSVSPISQPLPSPASTSVTNEDFVARTPSPTAHHLATASDEDGGAEDAVDIHADSRRSSATPRLAATDDILSQARRSHAVVETALEQQRDTQAATTGNDGEEQLTALEALLLLSAGPSPSAAQPSATTASSTIPVGPSSAADASAKTARPLQTAPLEHLGLRPQLVSNRPPSSTDKEPVLAVEQQSPPLSVAPAVTPRSTSLGRAPADRDAADISTSTSELPQGAPARRTGKLGDLIRRFEAPGDKQAPAATPEASGEDRVSPTKRGSSLRRSLRGMFARRSDSYDLSSASDKHAAAMVEASRSPPAILSVKEARRKFEKNAEGSNRQVESGKEVEGLADKAASPEDAMSTELSSSRSSKWRKSWRGLGSSLRSSGKKNEGTSEKKDKAASETSAARGSDSVSVRPAPPPVRPKPRPPMPEQTPTLLSLAPAAATVDSSIHLAAPLSPSSAAPSPSITSATVVGSTSAASEETDRLSPLAEPPASAAAVPSKRSNASIEQSLRAAVVVSLHDLRTKPAVVLTRMGVDVKNKEKHLSDDEFAAAMSCTRLEFSALPTWRQQQKKKLARIF